MAGLGTGAAPFRAFMQHRALVMSQGKPVGPMIYYFGSRHRSQEYLYGEEIEAYMKDEVITHAGLAFSRDSDSKVYIQHKMRQDGELLAGLISGEGEQVQKQGVFYLCGPTWPVPDVYEALVDALVQYAGRGKEEAGAYLEGLKEEERYVLEVSIETTNPNKVINLIIAWLHRSTEHVIVLCFGLQNYVRTLGGIQVCSLNNRMIVRERKNVLQVMRI